MAVSKQQIIDQLVASNIHLQNKTVELMTQMGKLTRRIDHMVGIFEEAAKNIKTEQSAPLMNKLERLIDQNKNIARGLILLERYVKEKSSFAYPPKPLPQTNL